MLIESINISENCQSYPPRLFTAGIGRSLVRYWALPASSRSLPLQSLTTMAGICHQPAHGAGAEDQQCTAGFQSGQVQPAVQQMARVAIEPGATAKLSGSGDGD